MDSNYQYAGTVHPIIASIVAPVVGTGLGHPLGFRTESRPAMKAEVDAQIRAMAPGEANAFEYGFECERWEWRAALTHVGLPKTHQCMSLNCS